MKNYSFQIDLLRAIAVSLVVFFHFNMYTSIIPFWNNLILSGGSLGVNIFFVISGLLISKPFVEKRLLDKTLPNIKIYIINRLFRIIPLFWVTSIMFFLCTDYNWLYNQSPYPITFLDSAKFLFFFYGKNGMINGPVWTLRFEILFYIFFPIFFWATLKLNISLFKHIVNITICLVGFFLFYRIWYLQQFNSTFYYDFFSNSEAFFLGIILSFLYTNEKLKAQFNIKFPILAPLLFLFIILKFNNVPFLNTKYTIAVVQTLSNISIFFLFIGILNANLSYAKKFFNKSISYISLISYSIYLLHFNIYYNLVIPLNKILFNNSVNKIFLGIAAIVITIILSTITYFLIEKPALQLKSKFIS